MRSEEGHEKNHQAKVQVIKPERGGMQRVTSQPGTIRAFEFAPLYTKVSGFVKTLNVDRGSRVKKGDLLAEIYDPERDVAVIQAKAGLEHSKAAVDQAEASILTAQATVLAAKAKQNEAKATYDKVIASRDYRKKEYERISELVERKSVEARLKDEELDEYHSSEAAVLVGAGGNRDGRGLPGRSQRQGRAGQGRQEGGRGPGASCRGESRDGQSLRPIHANRVALRRHRDLPRRVGPSGLVRPRRRPGRANEPLLTVAMTAKMRTIIPVPDRDVPYCQVGDPATITLDSLARQGLPRQGQTAAPNPKRSTID